MRLGEKQVLTVVKKVDFGVYLGSDEERVLLPKKQVPEGIEAGDPIEVFLYKDSSDRMIATTKEPKITLGQLAVLEVVDVGRIGAFLDWGLEKDLLLPFKEQTSKVEKGDRCLVSLYIDKSGRLCATMKVYPLLRTDSSYKKDDTVKMYIGQQIEARVAAVKADGKLDLSVRSRIPEQMDADAQKIMERLEKSGGVLPFTDKADPERIRDEFGMSKAAFKRAVGRLMKQGKIRIDEKQEKILQSVPNRL